MKSSDANKDSSAIEIFVAFLKLGLTSFGGPIAHLGYFRDELVTRRRWIDDAGYADTVALCQFLPGPASSQVGFALGILRGNGLAGGLAAWLGFTLPSALIMFTFALGAARLHGVVAEGFLHGLKLVAVAVVAQAIWGMARTLTPDLRRIAIAISAAAAVSLTSASIGQIGAISGGVFLGLLLCRREGDTPHAMPSYPITRRAGGVALAACASLLVIVPLLATATDAPSLRLFDAFFRSGALVFGGGHVILPLLQAQVVAPGWVSNAMFLDGYGLAQAIPGPLSTFAAYLGAIAQPPGTTAYPLLGAGVALIGIFLPGMLLVYGALPFWGDLRARPRAQAAMRGANAAVVGILAVAFIDPVCSSAIAHWGDAPLALAGFVLLVRWRVPSSIVVALLGVAGAALALLQAH